MIIFCPLCRAELSGRFVERQNGNMARFYWYCFDCKLSVLKSLKKNEEDEEE